MKLNSTYDVIIIGAGAAGLMCAAQAGQRGRRVLLIEHNDEVGKKILISGGGRCNFTNIHCSPANFLSQNPHFCISALSRFTVQDFIGLVEKYQIEYFEKTLGQLFCRDSAKEIVSLLLSECHKGKVHISLGTRVIGVQKNAEFQINTSEGKFESHALVIATGGLSIPKIGATDFGLQTAKQFGLSIVEPFPALVPFTWKPQDKSYTELSGNSFLGKASIGETSFQEKILFTHKGLSGPAILQISSYWNPSDEITIDLLPESELLESLLKRKSAGDRTELKNSLTPPLTKRISDAWIQQFGLLTRPICECSPKQLSDFAHAAHNWKVQPAATEGFAKAEVMGGGVDTEEISSKTFESKKISGLYFIGEVLDVTGHLGGHNFQWAWASGFCAGQYT